MRTRAPERVRVVALSPNQGKAEAVRTGLRAALTAGCRQVGYLDADLSTPPEELTRLFEVLASGSWGAVLGSRVGLLGWEIERTPARHYLGRLFATTASLALGITVYDTQCGAKVFRSTEALTRALESPFLSRWAFDVELLSRLTHGPNALTPGEIREEPLRVWHHVHGSKLTPRHMLLAAKDLARIAWNERRRR